MLDVDGILAVDKNKIKQHSEKMWRWCAEYSLKYNSLNLPLHFYIASGYHTSICLAPRLAYMYKIRKIAWHSFINIYTRLDKLLRRNQVQT